MSVGEDSATPAAATSGIKMPAYAAYQGQAGANQKMASNFGVNVTQWSSLNGGFGVPENFGGAIPASAKTFNTAPLTLLSVGGGAAPV